LAFVGIELLKPYATARGKSSKFFLKIKYKNSAKMP
jgi:hypothetical protein